MEQQGRKVMNINEAGERNGGDSAQGVTKIKMEDLRMFRIFFFVAQGIGILSIILMAVLTAHFMGGFAWRSNVSLEFNWHPLLLTIGFVYLYGNSIMIYRGLREMRKYSLKVIHASIHLVLLVIVIIGLVAVFDSHNYRLKPNLYSLHSWIGLGSVILFALQWILSFLAFLYPGASNNVRAAFLPYHVLLGLAIFVLGLVAALTGLTKLSPTPTTQTLPPFLVTVNVIGLCLVFFGLLVVYIVTNSNFKRYPRPEDGALLKQSPSE